MNKFIFIASIALLFFACERPDFRNNYSPGEVEQVGSAKVFHLADGVFIEEKKQEGNIYYLIESTVNNYKLTEEGLDIELTGDKAGTYSTTPAPQGFVAAWLIEVPGDGPGLTRFQVENAKLAGLFQELTPATTVKDIYNLKL